MQGAKDPYQPALGMPTSSSRARAGGGLRRNHGQTDRHEQTRTGSISPHHHHAGGRAGPRCASSPVGGVVPTPRATAGPRERTGHQSAHPTAQHRPDAFGERRRHGGFRTAHAQELNRPPHTAQQPSKSCSRRLSPRSSCMVFDLRKPAAMRPAKKTTRLGAR